MSQPISIRLKSDKPVKPSIPEPSPTRLVRRMAPKPGKKGLIKVGYACNNHCTFCHTLDIRDIDGTGSLVMRKIERARELDYGMVVLSGGEVTMRKELLLWAARTAALGMDFGLVTNARMLAYPELVETLMRLRLGYVYLSLHGGTAKIHNAMVRADAFDETFGAIRQLSGRNLDLTVNTVVTNTNLAHLRAMVDLMLPFPDLTLKFSMTQPKGGASVDHAFKALIPDIAECGARIHDAITYGQERVAAQGYGPRFAHDGVPFCLLPGYESLYDDLRTHDFASMTETFEPDYFPVDNGATIQPDEICGSCALRGPCPGLFTAYAELKGTSALRTVTAGTRSNSWTYAPERTLAKLKSGEAGGCPIHASPIPYDVSRTLFVDEGTHLVQYRTESRDFHDTETRHYKHALGQVYLDVSEKSAPDDFARDLRKLRLAPQCLPCERKDACANTYVVDDSDAFTPADRHVRETIGAVIARVSAGHIGAAARVIDVGCSDDGRYADLWEPAVREGRVRYLGIEPDAARAEALRARFPWAEVSAIPVEKLADLDAGLEAVLVLRSWNHIEDPHTALAPLVAALRPGATLLVVDNVAFGLCRSHAQRTRAETSGSLWEHFRNDDSTAARSILDAFPVDLIRETPVTEATANQWLLEYRKR